MTPKNFSDRNAIKFGILLTLTCLQWVGTGVFTGTCYRGDTPAMTKLVSMNKVVNKDNGHFSSISFYLSQKKRTDMMMESILFS